MEREVKEKLERHRSMAGAEILAVFDRSGFVKISSHDLSGDRVNKLLEIYCTALQDLSDLESVFPGGKPGFLITQFGNRYIYISPIGEGICLLGAFSTRTNFVKLMQAMASVTEDIKSKVQEISELVQKREKEYLATKKERTRSQPVSPVSAKGKISAMQVRALIDEFREELGPAGEIIFNQTAKDLGIDPRHMTREEAINLVQHLANEIENFQRKERFIKTALGIIES